MPEGTSNETLLSRREAGEIFDRQTGKLHIFRLRMFAALVLEVEDVHFHFDSAVLLPDFGDPKKGGADPADQNKVTGLSILRTAYMHASCNPEQQVLITGHTDRSGSDAYNQDLSELRADNVKHALLGNRDEWVAICDKKHKVEDYQQILAWVAETFGWDTHPGPKTNAQNAATTKATRNFQIRYNKEFEKAIAEDGKVGKETWGAFFDVYMKALKEILLKTDDAGLAELRAEIKFLDDSKQAVGCGENHPITENTFENQRSQVDRRVEILFFDPHERPQLLCHPGKGTCDAPRCEIYGPNKIFKIDPIPPDDWKVFRAFLKLTWKDPSGVERVFPRGFNVKVQFGDNAADTVDEQVGDDGQLSFKLDRSKGSFTLKFETTNPLYIVSAPGAPAPESEELLFEPEISTKITAGHRVWKLPKQWSLKQSDWLEGASPFDHKKFEGLEAPTKKVGTKTNPVKLTLDPHWQFLKFEYFDRLLKKRMSIPPSVIDGFTNVKDDRSNPATRSNWLTDPAFNQCLPWVVQRDEAGKPLNKPDGDVLLRYLSLPGTFIESTLSPESRRLVSHTARNPAGVDTPKVNNPGINGGAAFNFDVDKPSAERMRFYDLPQVWLSSDYWCKQKSAAGGAPDEGLFGGMGKNATTNDRPLVFCFDDVVLCDESLKPVALDPKDKLAIFCNRFRDTQPDDTGVDATMSPLGIHDPDNDEPWFSKPVERIKNNANYIAEYPDWVRLVIYQGKLYDVFDKRTPEVAGQVTGARAGVFYVDSPGLQKPRKELDPRPATTNKNFFSIQPFFEQRHDRFFSSKRGDDRLIGRFDMALLRCCDVKGNEEIALAMQYFRFFFHFNCPASDLSDEQKTKAVSTLTGQPAKDYIKRCLENVPKRWNGPDGTFTPGRGEIVTREANPTLRTRVLWFAQSMREMDKSHFELRIFKDIRGSMGGESGTGQFCDGTGVRPDGTTAPDNSVPGAGGFFTAAHETGHGGSLPDEYIEETIPISDTTPNVRIPRFDSFSPGSHFYDDERAMMRQNMEIRARYFWHVAEWMRVDVLGKQKNLQVEHAGFKYFIPVTQNAPKFTFVNWPLGAERRTDSGKRGRYDIFLYPMGEEKYTKVVLPKLNRATPSVADAFDGIVVVVVNMRFICHIDNRNDIAQELDKIQKAVKKAFNNKVMASGSASGVSMQRVLLHFSPRFRVKGISDDSSKLEDEHFDVDTQASGAMGFNNPLIGPGRTLKYTFGQAANFPQFFAQMIGIDNGQTNVAASYEPLFKKVMTPAGPNAIKML